MFSLRQLPTGLTRLAGAGRQRRGPVLCFVLPLLLGLVPLSAAQATADEMPTGQCPDLQAYYDVDGEVNWFLLERELARLQPHCLHDAEYYALYGAAQLNSGQVSAAMESLERALLLDPAQGAARVDYAQALYLQGQVFPAIELNRALLERDDLPAPLAEELRERHDRWRAGTRHTSGELDLMAGYDSNLNRGPVSRSITLTLAGEPVEFELSPEFQPQEGAYSNLRLAGMHTRQAPERSHHFLAEVVGRVSEDSNSDISRFHSRYTHRRPNRQHNWYFGAAVSHLMVGGQRLFSAVEGSLRYERNNNGYCVPYYSLRAQRQFYHQGNSALNAMELSNGGGFFCDRDGSRSTWNMELASLQSLAISANRPGGDRRGWRAQFDWEYELPVGSLISQLGYTRLQDSDGYSEVLDDGARRDVQRSIALLQYRYPLATDGLLLVNLYHQRQQSNLSLFRSNDTALEAGIRYRF